MRTAPRPPRERRKTARWSARQGSGQRSWSTDRSWFCSSSAATGKATESVVHRDAILKIGDAEPDKTVGASLVRIKTGWGGRASELSETLALFVEDGVLEAYLGEKPKTGGRQPKLYRRKT